MRVLPEALRPFAAYKQFILHRDKVPLNITTGKPHNPHDSAVWMDADTAIAMAAATGYGVGFVFTAADPFFFFDLDACLQPDGLWSQLSQDMCARFAGCAVEVSQSGQGLHIFGWYDALPEHACKNIPLGLELYTSDRFVALTGTGAAGDAAYQPDCLPWLVSEYFPPSAPVAGAEWTDGPCEEWSGPADDDELLQRMLASRGSASAVFSGRATVSQLWNADPDALAAAYPDERGFDHSSADAALCQHLAFWTGKDCERIDRLFRRSALYRDKWETREDYRYRSIMHAVGHCQNVLGNRPATPLGEAPEPVTPSEPMAPGDTRVGFQYLAITQQLEHFKGCVYIRDLHRVFTPDGALLKSEQFRAVYGGYVFALDTMSDKTSRNAWEVFTESQATIFPRAHSVCFRPEEPTGALIKEEGRVLLNTYAPIETPRMQGDAGPFLDHLQRVLPGQGDRDILLAYMAACVQHIGVKFQWAPLLQGCEGNGKTLFINCITHAVGNRYSHLPNASDLGGNGSKFNSWIQGKLFIGVEEIYVSDRREVSDALKPLITNSRVEIQGKGQDQITGDNRANFIMCSNHKDAILKTRSDRRYCVFYTAQQDDRDLITAGMAGSYFPDLYKWLRAEGYAIINDYLRSYAIPDALNPATSCHRAPATSSTDEAINVSLGGIEQEVAEAIDEGRPGFAGGWVSSMMLDKLLEARRDDKRITRNKRKELLLRLGYVLHPALTKGRVNVVVPQEGGKPRLYIKEGHLAANNVTIAADVLRLYTEAQGYIGGSVGTAAEVFSR